MRFLKFRPASIKRLRVLEDQLAEEDIGLTKRELLKVERERAKLDQALGGIGKGLQGQL